MEGWCMYCKSGTSNLDIVHKDGVGKIKVCPDCKAQHHDTDTDRSPDGGEQA